METIWAAVIAGTMALGGVWLGGKVQSGAALKQAKLSAIQRHNDQAAAAIAQLLLTTDQLQPDSFNWKPRFIADLGRISNITKELLGQQTALTTVSIGHPIKEIRGGMAEVCKLSLRFIQDTRDFTGTVYAAVEGNKSELMGLEEGHMGDEIRSTRDRAKTSWKALRDMIDLLADNLHEEEPPP